MATRETNELLAVAFAACEDKKAEDIRILKLDPTESGLTDYFLICNGTNDRQNVAITDEIEIRLKREFGVYPTSVEGRRQGEWVLMDYVDFIVHVFSAEKRAYYGLERLKKSATSVRIDELHEGIRPQKRVKKSTKTEVKTASRKVATKAAVKSPAKAAAKKAPAKKTAAKAVKKVTAKKSVKKAVKKIAKKKA